MTSGTLIKYVLIIILISTTSVLYAQSRTRRHTDNTNGWIMYFGNHKFSDRFGLHAEVQWRRHDVLSADQQLLLRGGLDYYLKNNNRLTIGYGFIETHPYGEFAVPNAFPEHRIWQQFLTLQDLGRIKLAHRYRLEQRMIGNAETGSMDKGRYENRFRYMAKVTFNITTNWDHPLFGAVYDEVFVNFGKDVAYNIFDQNRLYAAIGIAVRPSLKIEAGYLHQVVQLRSLDNINSPPLNKIEYNHTLQLGIFSTLSFQQKE